MFGYRVPAANEAMLISGGLRGPRGVPFRAVTGHGAFVMPILQKVMYLTLAEQEATRSPGRGPGSRPPGAQQDPAPRRAPLTTRSYRHASRGTDIRCLRLRVPDV